MGRYTTARSFDDRSTEVQAAPTEEQKAAAGKKDILEVSVRALKRKWRPCQREDARARSSLPCLRAHARRVARIVLRSVLPRASGGCHRMAPVGARE